MFPGRRGWFAGALLGLSGIALLAAATVRCTVMNGLRVELPDSGKSRHDGGGGDDDDDGSADDDGGGPVGPQTTPCDPATPFTKFNPINELNTADDEELPRLTRDELSIYYFAQLDDGGAVMRRADRTSPTSAFAAPVLFFPQVSGARQACPTADPLRLYFVSQGTNDFPSFDLHIAERSAPTDSFTPGRAVLEAGPEQSLAYPAFYDGPSGPRVLYVNLMFSGPSDDIGNPDIWTADLDGTGAVVGPHAVAGINTADVEYDPTPSADGLTLYFYSESGFPMNRGRIWLAQRASVDQPFASPHVVQEIAPPPNGYVSAAFLSVDRCRLYYYQAETPEGNADLFVASRSPPSP